RIVLNHSIPRRHHSPTNKVNPPLDPWDNLASNKFCVVLIGTGRTPGSVLGLSTSQAYPIRRISNHAIHRARLHVAHHIQAIAEVHLRAAIRGLPVGRSEAHAAAL